MQEELYSLNAQLESISLKQNTELQTLKTQFQIQLEKEINQEMEKWNLEKQKEIQSLVLQIKSESPSASSLQERTYSSDKKNSIPFEKMASSIKQLEAQVSSITVQLQLTTKTRDDLAQELLKLSAENEDLKTQSNQMQELQDKYKDLESRYQSALELVGEKTERIQDLTADIQEMRQVYQTQLEELLSKK